MNIKVKSMKVTPAVTLAKSRQKESEESDKEHPEKTEDGVQVNTNNG